MKLSSTIDADKHDYRQDGVVLFSALLYALACANMSARTAPNAAAMRTNTPKEEKGR